MTKIIQQIFSRYQQQFMQLFTDSTVTIALIEEKGLPLAKQMLCDMTQAYINEASDSIRLDKAARRQQGLVLQRCHDKRSILTQAGEINYQRDYYFDHKHNKPRYLVDELLGITHSQRLSDGLALTLAAAASQVSYAKSIRLTTCQPISRQTVMNKLRECRAKVCPTPALRRVAVLHIDADEAHTVLRGGQKSMVPLISVYEGIGQQGKRRFCQEVFHISEYGLDNERLWERVLDEIDRRYDISNTRIYLHGDGAGWIQCGVAYLPNCHFVLDKYHKNKYIKQMTGGISNHDKRRQTEGILRLALSAPNAVLFQTLASELCQNNPLQQKSIVAAAKYLLAHRQGIRICDIDEEANNGGCTEPHVSHILAARLSDRPRTWSKTTLKTLAPILACHGEVEKKDRTVYPPEPILQKAARKAAKVFKSAYTLGLPNPEAIGTLTPVAIGKVNPTYMAVRYWAQ